MIGTQFRILRGGVLARLLSTTYQGEASVLTVAGVGSDGGGVSVMAAKGGLVQWARCTDGHLLSGLLLEDRPPAARGGGGDLDDLPQGRDMEEAVCNPPLQEGHQLHRVLSLCDGLGSR